MANKINDADHILIALQFSPLSKSNARELTFTLGFQSAIERADSPVREIICPCVSTKTSFAKFDIVLKWVMVNSGHRSYKLVELEHILLHAKCYRLPIFTLDLPYMHEYNYTGVAQYI